jgi:hypothetical protein
MKKFLLVAFVALMGGFGAATGRAESLLSISPAALSLKGHGGEITTQHFKLSNFTEVPYAFRIDVTDVRVEGGKRIFIPAGQSAGSIAALAVLPISHVELKPGESTLVPVTFSLPAETDLRAVAVFFRGQPTVSVPGPRVRMNLGAVVDFSISDDIELKVAPPQVAPQTPSSSATFTEELANVGLEPVIVKGVAAIVSQPGKLVGKAVFEQKRLLPGERNGIHATYAGTLPAGTYRVLCSMEYAGQITTRTAELVIP